MTEKEVRLSQQSGNSIRVPVRRSDSEADSGRLSPLAKADVDLLMDLDALSIRYCTAILSCRISNRKGSCS